MIKVESIKIFPDGMTKAFVTILVHGIQIHGVRVAEGRHGLFVSMPQRQGKDDKYHYIVFVPDKELMKSISEEVLGAYRRESPDGFGGPQGFTDKNVVVPF